MSYTKETVGGKTMLKIDSSLTIYDATVLLGELLNCFENGEGLTLDVGAVTDCDAAGLQLLYAASKTARKNQQPFRVLGESKAIMDAMQGLGLNADESIFGS